MRRVGGVDAVRRLYSRLQALADAATAPPSTSIALVTCAAGRVAPHVLGDPAPHRGHRLDRLPGCELGGRVLLASLRCGRGRQGRWRNHRGRRRCGGGGVLRWGSGRGRCLRLRAGGCLTVADDGEDVLLRHPSPAAGAGDRRRVDAVLGGDAGDDRETNAARLRVRRGRAGGGVGSAAGGPRPPVRGRRRRALLERLHRCVGAAASAPPPHRRPTHPGEDGADVDGLAFLDEDLGQTLAPGLGTGVDLVGRDLEQRLVDRNSVADVLQPPRHRALGDGDAHLRHQNLDSDAGRH